MPMPKRGYATINIPRRMLGDLLQLPPGYSCEGAYVDFVRDMVSFAVSSNKLAIVEDGAIAPALYTTYERALDESGIQWRRLVSLDVDLPISNSREPVVHEVAAVELIKPPKPAF